MPLFSRLLSLLTGRLGMSRKTEPERLPPAIVKSFLGEEKDLPFHKKILETLNKAAHVQQSAAQKRTTPRSGFELRASSLVSYRFHLYVEVHSIHHRQISPIANTTVPVERTFVKTANQADLSHNVPADHQAANETRSPARFP